MKVAIDGPSKHLSYDPPEGWRFGFPKPYRPLTPDEDLEDTLRRDGYPQRYIDDGMAQYTRFLG